MESVPAERAAVRLAPQRHTSRHTHNESASHVDSTTASSQHRHHRHRHRSHRNGEEEENNGRGHKSSHTSRTAAAHESAVAEHDAVDVNAHNKRTHDITAAAPPVAHSHVPSSSARHHTRHAEHQLQQRSEEVRHEPEEEPQPHMQPNNTHENENGVVVGRGVPSRASLGNSARLPARTTRRTAHSIEGASASWLSNTLRSETMAEQEARRREVIAAYLGITPLREADIAALAPVPEFVEPLAETMRSSVLTKEDSVYGNKKNENVEKKHEAVSELDSRALQEAAETEGRLLLDQRDKKITSTQHSEGEKEESTVATQQHHHHHHHHHNHTRPETTVEEEAAYDLHKDAAAKADSVSPNKEIHSEHDHAAATSSPHVDEEKEHKAVAVQDVPKEVEASPARGYTYGDSDVSVHEAEEEHTNNAEAPPPLQVASVHEKGKEEEEDKAQETTPALNHTAPTSRPASASLHATPRLITQAEDMASRASLSSRGRPSAPKWVERLSTPTSRSHSANVAEMGKAAAEGGDIHSIIGNGDKKVNVSGVAQGSSVRRSATPQSAQRGRPPVRSLTPSVTNGANGRRASSASCSARLLQLAQPRRRYDPVAEERAVAEELALLQKEMKSTTATPRASVTNNNGRLVTGNAASASARPSMGATSLGSVRGRPIRVSAAGPVGSVTSRTASQPHTPITTDMDVKGGEAQTKNGDTNGDNETSPGMNVKEEGETVDNPRMSITAPSHSSRVSSMQQLELRQPTPRPTASNTPSLSSIPMDERVRLMQLPHAAYIAPTALRLDINSPEDMKELYRQQYLVDPQLHPRPARRQFRSTSQADLFGMYSRHPEWYNTQKNGNGAEGEEITGENNVAADATSLSEADAGRIRVGGRKQVPHREGLEVLPSASQKANDGMSILARFAVGGSATTDVEKDNTNGESAECATSDVVGTKQQQEGRYASNVSHFNLFSWNGFDATGQNDENNPCNGDQLRKPRGIAGRASVPTALAARDHLLNNLLPKENTSQDLKDCNYNNSARGEYGRPHVRGRAAIQAQYAAQPDNAPPGPRHPSARVTDVMKTLSAMGDHDIFGVEERNAQLVQRAALLAKSTPEKQPQPQISCGTSTMSVTTQTQERRNSNGVVVPYGVDYEEEEGEGLPAEAPMFQPRVANGTSMIH